MARLAVLRSAIFNGVRRQELASSWRQQTKAMKSTTAARPERILEPPYPEKMQIPEATITEFVWQDVGQWLSKPAVVRTPVVHGIKLAQRLSYVANNTSLRQQNQVC